MRMGVERLLASCRARMICMGLGDEMAAPLENEQKSVLRLRRGTADAERIRRHPASALSGIAVRMPRIPMARLYGTAHCGIAIRRMARRRSRNSCGCHTRSPWPKGIAVECARELRSVRRCGHLGRNGVHGAGHGFAHSDSLDDDRFGASCELGGVDCGLRDRSRLSRALCRCGRAAYRPR